MVTKKKEVSKTKKIGTIGAGALLLGIGTTTLQSGDTFGGCLIILTGLAVLVLKRGYFFG